MGSDSEPDSGELSMLSAASGPSPAKASPAKGPLAAKEARAAAAAMDLDSSAETSAADESFPAGESAGLAALNRRGSGVNRGVEVSFDDGTGELAVKADEGNSTTTMTYYLQLGPHHDLISVEIS